jgi:beta-glucanase (GH16 family)
VFPSARRSIEIAMSSALTLLVFLASFGFPGRIAAQAADDERTVMLDAQHDAHYDGYSLFFSDEFDPENSGAPNPDYWDYDVSRVRNQELQCYTDDRRANVRVERRTFDGVTDGYLVLELRKERFRCSQDGNRAYNYTSGAITSRKRDNGNYLIGGDPGTGLPFGIYQIRAKIPSGRGTWPAIWIVGHKSRPDGLGWPEAGEIDIMEAVGFEEANGLYRLHSHLHRSRDYHWPDRRGKTGQGMFVMLEEPPSARFHVWTMIWTPESIEFFVDGRRVTDMQVRKENGSMVTAQRRGFFRSDASLNARDALAWPFSKELGNEFRLILNLAYGGNWGGQQGVDDSIFGLGPVEMLVDYVRIYTKD